MMTGAAEADRIAMFTSIGMTNDVAAQVAPWVNDDMARCILGLYRSAAQPAMGARSDRLDGLGHWWMLQDPATAADMLIAHWQVR